MPKTKAKSLNQLEREWRQVIRLRCEWATMLYGSYKYITIQQLTSDTLVCNHESEKFGPPNPFTARFIKKSKKQSDDELDDELDEDE